MKMRTGAKIALFLVCGLSVQNASGARRVDDWSSGSAASAASPSKELPGLDLDQLLRDIQATEKKVQEKMQCGRPDSIRVLVLGTTGSGKSTLVHGLAGRPLEANSAKKGRRTLDVKGDPLDGFSIGHGLGSETQVPNIWYDKQSNLIYCDCPGFMDSRGVGQEIVNAFAIDQLFASPSRIKILFAIQESDFEGARGMEAIDRLNKLLTLVPNVGQLNQALILMMTKSSGAYSVQDKIEGLLADTKEEFSGQHKGSLEIDHLEAPIALLSSLSGNKDKAFSFPAPKKDGAYGLFEDQGKVIQGLGKMPLVNARHNISFAFDSDVVVHIYQMIQRSGNVHALIPELMGLVHNSYRGQDLKTLREWATFGQSLLGVLPELETPEKFALRFKGFLPETHRQSQTFGDLAEKIRGAQRYLDFATRVGAVQLGALDVQQLVKPALENMNRELQGLIASKEALEKQEAETKRLSHDLDKAVQEGKIAREEADRQIKEIQEQAKKDNLQIAKELKSLQKAKEAIEQDMKRKLKEQEEQNSKAIEDLKSTIKTERTAAEQRAAQAAAEQRLALAMSNMSMGGPSCGMPQMGGFGGMPPGMDFGGGFGGMNDFGGPPRSRSHHASSRQTSPMTAPKGMTYVQGYTRSNGTQVSGYLRSSTNRKRG